MRLCTTSTTTVRRIWTVELRPESGGPVLVCPQCTSDVRSLPGASGRSAALAHLARHARREVLPPYLRTCQCHGRGCRWHPRHRGCSGPVLLVLTCERNGRLWRLADACSACAGATTHAAIVPDTVFAASPTELSSGLPGPGRARRRRRPGSSERVLETLSYLAAALPVETSAEARLLAVQCALRTNSCGLVHLPAGLLRGMRLNADPTPWQDLEQAHWLHRLPAANRPASRAASMQLLDPAVLSQLPGRAGRIRTADWALRTSYTNRLRCLDVAGRLTALALAAHTPAGESNGTARCIQLNRMCGLPPHQLHHTLDGLIRAGFIVSWLLAPDSENLTWTADQPQSD